MTVETVERTTLPLTGEEYLESLRDGREIWIYGERVKDITTVSSPKALDQADEGTAIPARCATRSAKVGVVSGVTMRSRR